MAQQLEPVQFDEFLSNAASIFSQIETASIQLIPVKYMRNCKERCFNRR